jgi:hypothetical protein
MLNKRLGAQACEIEERVNANLRDGGNYLYCLPYQKEIASWKQRHIEAIDRAYSDDRCQNPPTGHSISIMIRLELQLDSCTAQ